LIPAALHLIVPPLMAAKHRLLVDQFGRSATRQREGPSKEASGKQSEWRMVRAHSTRSP
jgi:hypothetical protein